MTTTPTYWETYQEHVKHRARELSLYIENTEPIYTRYLLPLLRRYEQRHNAGRFDRTLAINGMMRVCLVAAQEYKLEIDTPGRWSSYFPKEVRKMTATELVDDFITEMSAGNSYL